MLRQLRGEYSVKKTELIPYHKKASQLLAQFQEVKILYIRRAVNARSDALASLAASLLVSNGEECHITVSRRRLLVPLSKAPSESTPEEVLGIEVEAEQLEDWRAPFLDFLERGRLPGSPTKRIEIRRRSTKFVDLKGLLYRRSPGRAHACKLLLYGSNPLLTLGYPVEAFNAVHKVGMRIPEFHQVSLPACELLLQVVKYYSELSNAIPESIGQLGYIVKIIQDSCLALELCHQGGSL